MYTSLHALKTTAKVVSGLLGIVLFVITLSGVGFLVGSRFGWIPYRVFYVTSGSMEPTLPLGAVVLTTPKERYQPGAIITFRQPGQGNVVTHRIVEVNYRGQVASFVTKGDANDTADNQAIPDMSVFGEVLYFVPYLGRVIAFVQTKVGIALTILVPAGILVLWEVGSFIRKISSRSAQTIGKEES